MHSAVLLCGLLAHSINAVTTVRITQQIQLTQTVYRSTASASAEPEVTADHASATTTYQPQVAVGAPSQADEESMTTSEVAYPVTTSSSSITDLAQSKPRVIVMGTITLTAGGISQTMSNKQYSLDDCHLFIGTATATLCSSQKAQQATATPTPESKVAQPSSSSNSHIPNVYTYDGTLTLTKDRPTNLVNAKTMSGFRAAITSRPTLLGTGSVRSNGTSVTTPATGSSTTITRTRLPWSSSETSSASATSSGQASSSDISEGSARRSSIPLSALVWIAAAAALTCWW
ncbi:hypothetical protein Slin14017_G129940 [Septoria linicola]|nr:hypothetical protein Slin14017_G129940 [Septoria linicola]